MLGKNLSDAHKDVDLLIREIEAIAKTGSHFTRDPFDSERYQRLRQIADQLLSVRTGVNVALIQKWTENDFG